MFSPIKTAPALQQAITSTYILDAVFAVAIVFVMILAANLVQWQGGKNDHSGSKRRTWFFILLAFTLIGSILFDFFAFFRQIGVPAFAGKYLAQMCVASVVATVVYFGIGFAVIKIAPRGSKLNSIFPKKDK